MNITQQVAQTLGKAIVGGEYGVHNPVPSEAILREQLEVSRSVAREAVKSLAAKGLLTSRARQGIRVSPESEWNLFDRDVLRWIRDANPSLELLREFSELRVTIEREAARLAAQRQNKAKIELIGQALERMKRAESGGDDPLESDIAFHLSVLNASENRFFAQLGSIIDITLRVSIRFTNMLSDVRAGSYADHKKIYDAIVRNQPDKAAKEAEKLVKAAAQLIGAASSDVLKRRIN